MRLPKWLSLPSQERWLVVQALLLVLGTRVGLKVAPLRSMPQLVAGMDRLLSWGRNSNPPSRERIAWAVRAVTRHTLGDATCLIQALVAQQLLQRSGYPARLCIGVARGHLGRLIAHAWVESDGTVVIGGPNPMVEQYKQFERLTEALS